MRAKLKLKYKLFLILFSASILLIACMFFFTRISFERGLNRYVDRMEMKRLGSMCRVLEERYAVEKSWDFLRNNPADWIRLKKKILRKLRYEPRREYRLHHMFKGKLQLRDKLNELRKMGPNTPDGTGKNRQIRGKLNELRSVPPHTPDGTGKNGLFRDKLNELRKRGPGRGRKHRTLLSNDKYPTVILIDKDKTPIFGKVGETEEVRLMPVMYRNETVGWLGMVPPESFIESEELLFYKAQTRTFLLISAVMTLLSVIIAIWAAFYLERPIKVLTKGTRVLTSGAYDIRIAVASGDELGQLSRDFNTLAETLGENERSRKQWVQDIAHELRTPLTLLSGELEAVQDGVRKLTPETLELLQGDIARLVRLVSDLNELSRTDLGALSYKKEKIDLVGLLHRVVERFQEEFASSDLLLEDLTQEEGPAKIFADEERIGQLLGNILQNSLDYTHPGGQVKIRLEQDKGKVVVNVEDSEPGVPEAELPKLFDRFYRLEPSRNRKFGGTGLGLCICRNIAVAHKGEITAMPSPAGGIWIKIELPLIT